MRQFMKKIAAACVGVATAAALLAPVADARPVVNQGDRVRLDMGLAYGICTVGYVDRARNQIAIARHCVKFPFQQVLDGSGRRIGTVVSFPGWLVSADGPNDFAYATLSGATAGANRLSGDAKVHPDAVRPGERVCAYGATTRREFCGHVTGVRGNMIATSIGGPRHGDSGGPIWIPGRGFVAVTSGGVWKDKKYWLTGSYPELYFGPELLSPVSMDLDQPTTSSNSTLGWYARQLL